VAWIYALHQGLIFDWLQHFPVVKDLSGSRHFHPQVFFSLFLHEENDLVVLFK
jgi:hypothetical protein